jgi:hypothetical protein
MVSKYSGLLSWLLASKVLIFIGSAPLPQGPDGPAACGEYSGYSPQILRLIALTCGDYKPYSPQILWRMKPLFTA